ncbi:MAG: TIGR03087 family PEP-CTERM/XrtA system glycosyltransferase [Burkholderiales bacterium]
MAELLYLVHRLPYPPNKGDKVRSYHLLRHLARRHRVHLGTFVDDPADLAHLDTVRGLCAEFHWERLDPRASRVRSLMGLATGEALSLPYYRNAGLQAWVDRTLAAHPITTSVLFSSPMVQYVERRDGLRRLVDFVDVDSDKWTQYAQNSRWPLSWLYRREGRTLGAFEAEAATRAVASFFVTDAEVALFRKLAPAVRTPVESVGNGVDADYYTPEARGESPYPAGEVPVVFTGAMDYWPNVDAACWFAGAVLPLLRRRHPGVRFYVVGMRPTAEVRALAGPAVVVTGTVPDIRPYLAHAAVAVAPLRIARGIQNKILEAMAAGKAVVAARACADPIEGMPGREFLVATEAADFAEEVGALIADPARAAAIGRSARACVLAHYSWEAQLARMDRYLDTAPAMELA